MIKYYTLHQTRYREVEAKRQIEQESTNSKKKAPEPGARVTPSRAHMLFKLQLESQLAYTRRLHDASAAHEERSLLNDDRMKPFEFLELDLLPCSRFELHPRPMQFLGQRHLEHRRGPLPFGELDFLPWATFEYETGSFADETLRFGDHRVFAEGVLYVSY